MLAFTVKAETLPVLTHPEGLNPACQVIRYQNSDDSNFFRCHLIKLLTMRGVSEKTMPSPSVHDVNARSRITLCA